MNRDSMNSEAPPPPQVSLDKLGLTVAIAAVLATLLYFTVVLPAEYGRDPLGTGKLLGLDKLANPSTAGAPAPPMPHSAFGQVTRMERKSETISIEIAPRQEVEHKLGIAEHQAVLYRWTSSLPVYSDFHGHPYNDLDLPDDGDVDPDAVRYKETLSTTSEEGSITAQFSGFHGWYWRNETESPVTVTLEIDGYYTHTEEHHRASID